MSLNESPDCKIEKIIQATPAAVVAVSSVTLDDEQMDYFFRNQDCLSTDLHSTKARLGINQAKLTDFEFNGNKISYEAKFWFYIPEYSAGVTIDQLITPGLAIGKIYLRNPKLKYFAEELINLISNRTIIVPKGTRVLDEGILVVPLKPYIHPPNPKVLTADYLRAAVQKRIPRDDLYFAQPEQKVDKIVVPANNGVITHTSLFTQQNELYILDQMHTDARVGSKHTNGFVYIELVGTDHDVTVDSIHAEVYKPALSQHRCRKQFFIDTKSSMLEGLYKEGLDDHTAICIGEDQQQKRIHLNGAYGDLLRELQPNSSLVLQNFPNRLFNSYLMVAADMGLIRDMTFRRAPEEEYFFRSEHLAFMNALREMGVGIYWKNPRQGDLVLHRRFFMRSSVIAPFNEAFGSRKLAALYGTAGPLDKLTQKEVVGAVESFKAFHGGICGILTGGNAGSIMSFVAKTTGDLGMLSGAVYWKVPGVDIDINVDFAAYLARFDLLERQEILSETTEADIYFRGGVGTNLENAITFVKKKLGIGYYKPQIFVGDFYAPLRSWLNHMAKEKLVDAKIFDNCYFIKHGDQLFDTLCNHFGAEDKMIHEVSSSDTDEFGTDSCASAAGCAK